MAYGWLLRRCARVRRAVGPNSVAATECRAWGDVGGAWRLPWKLLAFNSLHYELSAAVHVPSADGSSACIGSARKTATKAGPLIDVRGNATRVYRYLS